MQHLCIIKLNVRRTSEEFRCKIQVTNLLLVMTCCICAVDDRNSCSSFYLFSFSLFILSHYSAKDIKADAFFANQFE